MAAKQKDVVVVTGFGPFREHKVNASWEVVKLVPSKDFETELDAQIVIKEIPVIYEYVSKMVPELWEYHKPTLVVHVGVSSYTDRLTLENFARNAMYSKTDINKQIPESGHCCDGSPYFIPCLLDLESIAREVEVKTGVKANTSVDAGRFLCEFTYYLSLKQNASSTVFIHVPVLDKYYSAMRMATAIKFVIKKALEQAKNLRENKEGPVHVIEVY